MSRSFFFQAEDGIRDGHVTGVQTCALPISPAHRGHTVRGSTCWTTRCPWICRTVGTASRVAPCSPFGEPPGSKRSEERRVGKECRSRWAAYHEKKNRKY